MYACLKITCLITKSLIFIVMELFPSHLLDQPTVQDSALAPGHGRPIRLQLPGGSHAEGSQEEAEGGQGHGDHRLRNL